MIFLTVGTEYPFDRLIKKMDDAVGSGDVFDDVFAQIGKGKYRPVNMSWAEMLSRDEFDNRLVESAAVVSHAGMGTIIRCIELRKPLLVVPRRSAYGEHVNDHQVSTARKLVARDDLLVVDDVDQMLEGIRRLEVFEPSETSPASARLLTFLREYLDSIDGGKSGDG